MRVGITGGSGFVGRHVAGRLLAAGHAVVLVARGVADLGAGLPPGDRVQLVPASIADQGALAAAFVGCEAVVHCAGINRQLGSQTYAAVHVAGTRNVVDAARQAGVERLVMLSFLRARVDGPDPYHRSKWEAEEVVRGSGLAWSIFKAGVIHGRGDHLLDHLSRALATFPVFALVGRSERLVRPVAVDDVARILAAAAEGDARLAQRTTAVLGPETITLGEAVRRVSAATGQRTRFVRLPVWAHLVIARIAELVMVVPMVSVAQVRILAEGVAAPLPGDLWPPADLEPSTPFSREAIRAGLPEPGGFGRRDLRRYTR